MKDYFSGIISILASFQLLFVAIFLISNKKGSKRNNRLLGILFLLFAISLGDFAIRITEIEVQIQVLHLIDDGFFFLYGPLIFFYVRGVVYLDFRFRTRHLLHLIPFAIYLLYLFYTIVFMSADDRNQITSNIVNANLPVWMYLASISIYIYNLSYLWFANQTVNTYRRIIKNTFSSMHQISLGWLKFIIQSFALITIIAMIHNVTPALNSILFLYFSLLALLVYTFIFINRVLFKALKQPEIFAGIELQDIKGKYEGSSLTEKEIRSHYLKLLSKIEDEKLFLNPVLTLQELSGQLDVSSKILSQVINQSSGKNFFDFINFYRCEEVKRMMQASEPKVTIQEIMFQCGFNSKSSFNKEFKKLSGFTPTEYRKSVRIS